MKTIEDLNIEIGGHNDLYVTYVFDISHKIGKYLDDENITNVQFANNVGVTLKTVEYWLSRNCNFNIYTLSLIESHTNLNFFK